MKPADPKDRNPPSVGVVYRSIGEFTCAFSNNESVLALLIEILLRSDRAGAILVFGTLNTTRARIDLLRRLARARLVREPELLKETEGLLPAFENATRFRNDILHAMYVYDINEKTIVETQAMRIDERRATVSYGKSRPMDGARIAAIGREVEKLNTWNRSMWTHISKITAAIETKMSVGESEPANVVGEGHDLRS